MMDRGPWLLTQSGTKFFPLHPAAEDINILDIAAGLCRTTRFNGQLKEELEDDIYTVAQHSVYVARMVEMIGHHEAAYWGLMHDAVEAFYGDMISPVKRLIPMFEELEDQAAEVCRDKYMIPYSEDIAHTVHIADKSLAIMESSVITSVPADMWDIPLNTTIDIHALDPEFYCWGPRKARYEFLVAFNKYAPREFRV